MKTLANSKRRASYEMTATGTGITTHTLELPRLDDGNKLIATRLLDFRVIALSAASTSVSQTWEAIVAGGMSLACYNSLVASELTTLSAYLDESIWAKAPQIDRMVALNSTNVVYSFISALNANDEVEVITPFTDTDTLVSGSDIVLWSKGNASISTATLRFEVDFERVQLTSDEFMTLFAAIGC